MSRRARRRLSQPLRRGMLSEGRRMTLAIVVATAISVPLVTSVPALQWMRAPDQTRLTSLAVLFVLTISLYSALEAALTHLALRRLPRAHLVTLMRLSRARAASRWYRWTRGRGTVTANTTQLILLAGVVLYLIVRRPAGFPLWLLLALAVWSVLTAWLATVVSYACEYAGLDGYGDGFEMPGTPAGSRTYEEYLHVALLVQTSSAPSDTMPLTRASRRAIRGQSVFAYVMNSVLIAVGTSVVITALGGGA